MKNIKFILGFIIVGVICTTFGVYATMSYQANQINYKTTTLDHALDDLYTAKNTTISTLEGQVNSLNQQVSSYSSKYDSITVRVLAASSTTGISNGRLACVDLYNQYKKFKVIELTGTNASECVAKGYASILSSNNWVTLELNKEYNNYSSTDGYRFSNILANLRSTAEGTNASCQAKIQFYN